MKYLLVFTLMLSATFVSAQVTKDTLSTTKKDTAKVAAPIINYLKKSAYQIIVPSGWKSDPNCPEKNCTLTAPGDTIGPYDSYTESINIVFENLSSKSYTVDQYADFSKGYLPKVVKGFKVLERKKLKPNVIMMVYTGEKNSFPQTWRQYYYVKNQKVYIVTFACEPHKYAYYLPIVTESLASFKVL